VYHHCLLACRNYLWSWLLCEKSHHCQDRTWHFLLILGKGLMTMGGGNQRRFSDSTNEQTSHKSGISRLLLFQTSQQSHISLNYLPYWDKKDLAWLPLSVGQRLLILEFLQAAKTCQLSIARPDRSPSALLSASCSAEIRCCPSTLRSGEWTTGNASLHPC